VTVEDSGPCKKKVLIEIPEERILKETDEQYRTLGKDAQVPGFRRGRAPRRLLEKRFGKDVTEQIKLKLMADACENAIKDNELAVLGDPDIKHEGIELPEKGSMKFDFEVEVRPQFELPELEGIAVNKPKLEVTDEQVSSELEQYRRYAGVWTPKEGGKVEEDDQVIADVVLKAEDVEEGQKLNNTEIHVRANGFVGGVPVKDLDELLAGAKAGDRKETSVEVPKTFFREEYRGKKVAVNIEIKDIKWLKPADIDAEFLKRFGCENEEEMRDIVKTNMQNRREKEIREDMSQQIFKYLLEKVDFDLPTDMVSQQAVNVFRRKYVNLLQMGLSRERIDEQMEQLRAGSEEEAKEQLKTFFVMDKVGEKLGIEVSDEEINGHIAQLAIEQGQRPERMREEMVKNGSLAQFRIQIRENKAVEKMLESAKITEVEAARKEEGEEKPKKAAKKPAKKAAKEGEEKPAKESEEPKEPKEAKEKAEKKAKPTRKKKTE
jgi:trigger factor